MRFVPQTSSELSYKSVNLSGGKQLTCGAGIGPLPRRQSHSFIVQRRELKHIRQLEEFELGESGDQATSKD
jgi:hypothetical protein